MVQHVNVNLYLPDPTIEVGPDPSANEWNMAVVGYPLWLWTPSADAITTTATNDGLTFTMSATRTNITLDMGDGTTVRCAQMTPHDPSVKPGTPSPNCGHTYRQPSLPQTSYTIRATSEWTIQWNALGFTGQLPGTTDSTTTIPVGELQSVVRR